jgi:hypothetical protein
MSRMNGRDRARRYGEISDRYGEYCHLCGALPADRPLVIHHKDNNNYNNTDVNLTLLCRTCNYTIHPRMEERPVDSCVSPTSYPSALSVNRMKEQGYRKHIYRKIINDENTHYKRLIVSSAEFIGISPVTSKRYLDKMCSDEGILHRLSGHVRVKEDWEIMVSTTDMVMIEEILAFNEQMKKDREDSDKS